MFGFLKRKSMKKIRQLTTPEGHKATITKETTPHLNTAERFHVSIYSKIEDCIIYGQVVNTSIEDAEKVVNNWQAGLLKP